MKAGLPDLPSLPGAYILEFWLPQPAVVIIGRLGRRSFPAGAGFYLGSACGPGGLKARLGRHLRPGDLARPHWHIDYLHGVAQPRAAAYLIQPQAAPGLPLECRWSRRLAALTGACVPLPGFGASDCRAGCRAHLVMFADEGKDSHPLLERPGWLQLLAEAAGRPPVSARLPG
jgi:Uri superfamily endonuclease